MWFCHVSSCLCVLHFYPVFLYRYPAFVTAPPARMWRLLFCCVMLPVPATADVPVMATTGAYLQFLPSVVYLEHVRIEVHKPLPPSLTANHSSTDKLPSCFQNLTCAVYNQTAALRSQVFKLLDEMRVPASAHHRQRRGFMSFISRSAKFLRPLVDKALDALTDSDDKDQIRTHHVEDTLSLCRYKVHFRHHHRSAP